MNVSRALFLRNLVSRFTQAQRINTRRLTNLNLSCRKGITIDITRRMATSQAGKGGEFKANVPKQEQELPGLERDMEPTSESTKLESSRGFQEYVGSNKLLDKAAIITGGDSGIGRAIAALYAREGCDVTVVYLPSEQVDADETKRLVESSGRQCNLIPFDLEDLHNLYKIVDNHMQRFGRLDILVNNASKQVQTKEFEDLDIDMMQSVFRSNVMQMLALTKFAVKHIPKGGSVINTTSVVAFRGTASMVDYAATKGAIVGFTRALSKNLISKGIRVNAVAPGPVHTPLQPASRPEEQMEGFGKQSQIGRAGQPVEIATSFVFLASKDASLYYGQILHAYPMGD
ncbi:general stress protein 39 [Ascodesmis nigricans]|uniref:General stress protein 39 n=1 Tax=Ascodesmis nigricans TaxID=341454 RepID=A0A4S2MTT4_9PEZI|nr:general stress protein 39 [Ascodesmis nigricans]